MRSKGTSNKTMNMKVIGIVIMMMIVVVKCDDDDIDPVIDMLLNGVVPEYTESNEDDAIEPAPRFVGGIWKCGNCTDLINAELMHAETNEVHADMDFIDNVEVQISLAMDAMRCIIVSSEKAGVVRKVLGSCTGSTITLSMAASNYTILVYK